MVDEPFPIKQIGKVPPGTIQVTWNRIVGQFTIDGGGDGGTDIVATGRPLLVPQGRIWFIERVNQHRISGSQTGNAQINIRRGNELLQRFWQSQFLQPNINPAWPVSRLLSTLPAGEEARLAVAGDWYEMFPGERIEFTMAAAVAASVFEYQVTFAEVNFSDYNRAKQAYLLVRNGGR